MNTRAKHRITHLPLVTLMILGAFITQPLSATTQAAYYVSPQGNDSNPGTLAAPFLTIQKAQTAVRSIDSSMQGDIIIYLRAGTYPIVTSPLVFNSSDSGTNGFHVIYQAYGNEVPVISGGVPVTGWTLDHGNVYRASLDRTTKLRSLFVNGVRAFMTRSPNPITGQGSAGTFTIQGTEPWVLNGASGSEPDDIQFNSSDVQPYANPGDVELVQNHGFNSIIVSVRNICLKGGSGCNEASNLYTDFQLQQPYGALAFSLLYGTSLNASGPLYVQNAYELLNSPGQFYFNRTTQTLYYYSRGEDMSKAQVIAPSTEGLLQIHGASNANRVKNLEFIGITFAFDHWQMYDVAGSTGMAAIQSVAGQIMFAGSNGFHADVYNDTQTAQASIDIQNADSITFQGDSFQHLSSGIALSLTDDVINSSIIGNSFVDLSGNAINVGNAQNAFSTGSRLYPSNLWGVCTNDIVKDNYIRLPNQQYYQFEGLSAAYVNSLQLLHNDMAYTGYTGISLGWGWVNTPTSTTSQNNTVEYNRIDSTNQTLNGDGGAMYTLGQMPNSTVSYNYVSNSPDEIYPDQGSSHINFTYNVLANSVANWLYLWNATAMPDLLIDNTYTNTTAYTNAAANTPSSNDVVSNTHYETTWDSSAQAIINSSGLESQYHYMLNPASVTGLNASMSSNQVTLTWQATGVATSFNIYRGTASNGEGSTPYQSGVMTGNFIDSSVTAGTIYYYKVTAVGPTGESNPSNEVSASLFTTTPSTLYKVISMTSGSGLVLDTNGSTQDGTAILQNTDNSLNNTFQQWHIVNLGTGYSKLLNIGSGKCLDNGGVQVSGDDVIQWDDQATTNTNQQWQFSSSGSNEYYLLNHTSSQYLSDGKPSGTNNQSVGNPMTQYPTTQNAQFEIIPINAIAPSSIVAVAESSQINLSWQSNGVVASFNIYRGTTSGGEGSTPYHTGITGTTFTDSSVTTGSTYYYKITSVNQLGESSPSIEVSATAFSTTVVYKVISVTSGSGMVLDTNGSTQDGTAIVQNPDNSLNNTFQQWNVVSLGSGRFKLLNVGSGKCIDNGGVQVSGDDLIQWDDQATSNTNQQWLILRQQNGNYFLVDHTSNQYLSDGSPSGANNQNADNPMTQWPTTQNAQFQIVPIH